jgi:RNA polymerase sigma factor (sigma-70 family)
VDDRELAEALASGDPGGLAGVYDQYSDRLYTYCWSLLRNRDAAADAMHDTFVIAAQRIGQLRDAERLRAWLYAIARNECLRQLRQLSRTAELDEAFDVADDSIDMDSGLRNQELRALLAAALEGLNPREREVIQLAVQHRLEVGDVADAMGLPAKQVHALLSTARQQLERSLSALIVARTGQDSCAELASLLQGWDGQLTVLLRKRITRHLETCEVCSEEKRRRVRAEALLAGIPFMVPPVMMRGRVMGTVFNPQLVGYRQQLTKQAGQFTAEGFPIPHDRDHSGPLSNLNVNWKRVGLIAGVVMLIALLGGGAAAWKMGGHKNKSLAITDTHSPSQQDPNTDSTSPLTTTLPTPTPTATPTATPTSTSPSPSPTRSRTPSRTPGNNPPPPPPPPPSPADLVVTAGDPITISNSEGGSLNVHNNGGQAGAVSLSVPKPSGGGTFSWSASPTNVNPGSNSTVTVAGNLTQKDNGSYTFTVTSGGHQFMVIVNIQPIGTADLLALRIPPVEVTLHHL